MFKKETINAYIFRIEKWMQVNRKSTVAIMFSILIVSFGFVILRKKETQYNPADTYSTFKNVKATNSVRLSKSFSDIQKNFSILSDINSLKSLDTLSKEDSLKLEAITKSLLKD